MGFWRSVGRVARIVFPVHYVANLQIWRYLEAREQESQAADPRPRYFPRPASYGQMLPVVYGTTLVPAPALCRGRLEVNGDIWKQHQLVLALCQGPAAAVRAVWLFGGAEGETTAAGSVRVEWPRMVECGATFQAGALTGNMPTNPAFARGAGTELLVATDGNRLRLASHVLIEWTPTSPPEPRTIDHWEVERGTSSSGPWTAVVSIPSAANGGASFYERMTWSGKYHFKDIEGGAGSWYRVRYVDDLLVAGAWYTAFQGSFVESTGSFLPTLAGATSIRLVEALTSTRDPNFLLYGALDRLKRLDGTYAVTAITDKEITLSSPGLVNANWNFIGTDDNVQFSSSYWLASSAGGIYYPGIAHIRADPLDLAALYSRLDPATTLTPAYGAEISGFLANAGTGSLDAEGADVIADIIGSNYWAANVRATVEADLGIDGTAASGCRTYCRANGFFVSGMLDDQRSAAEHIQSVLDAIDCVVIDCEQKLKIVPLGDEAITANGYTYTPVMTPAADLTASDGLATGDEAMISMGALPDELATNVVSVEYRDRNASGAAYRISVETAQDGSDIEAQAIINGGTGKREAATTVLHWITNSSHARRIAQLRLQRALGVRNAQVVRTGWRWARLWCMDPLTLTDPAQGLDHVPVRIAAVEEDQDGNLSFETLDWPTGMSGLVSYSTQPPASPTPVAQDPGVADEPIVLPVPPYVSGLEHAVWIAATGQSTHFGGCDVHVSTDGVTYHNRGAIYGRSAIGHLINALPAASGLDATNPLDVDMSTSSGALAGTTDAGRDNLDTLCWVDGELLAFRTVAAYDTSPYRWRLTSLRRGAYGTTGGSHAADTAVVRIDPARVLYVTLPAAAFGAPLYVKLVPFNVNGTGRPDLSSVPAHAVTVALPVSLAPTGPTLAVTASAPAPAANQWRASADELAHARWARVLWTMSGDLQSGFEVVLYEGSDPDDTSKHVVPARIVPANVRDAVLAVSAGAAALTVRASVRARFASGAVSAWATTGTDTIPANTNVASQALTLAGTKMRVYYQGSAPTGAQENELWFSTDTTTACPVSGCKGTLNDDGTQRSPATHRAAYWPHRYVSSAWVDAERQALLIASEIAAGAIVTDKLGAKSATLDKLTIGGAASGANLWPNPTSEEAPPTGADTTTAEWAYRYNAGAGAYAGNWVRRLVLAQAGYVGSYLTVPCAPGEQFRLEAYAKLISGTPSAGSSGVRISWVDAAENYLGTTVYSAEALGAAWGKISAQGTAPDGAVRAWFGIDLLANGACTLDFDGILARRMVSGELIVNGALKTSNYAEDGSGFATAGVKLDHTGTSLKAAVNGVRFGPTLFSDLWSWGQRRRYGTYSTNTLSGYNSLSSFGGSTTDQQFVRGVVEAGGVATSLKVTAAGNYIVQWRAEVTTSIVMGFQARLYNRATSTALATAQTYVASTSYRTYIGDQVIYTLAANDDIDLQVYCGASSGTSFYVENYTVTITRLPD